MLIKKGKILRVVDQRKGTYIGIAARNFDTVKDEWYSINVYQMDTVEGITDFWEHGDAIPARRGITEITIIK